MIYTVLAIVLFITEVIIATVLKEHLCIRAYLGGLLLVILLYCIAKSIYDFDSLRLAITVLVFATVIEITQYFHLADLLGLSERSIALIVVSTSFSMHDLLMYASGCLVADYLDVYITHRHYKNSLVL